MAEVLHDLDHVARHLDLGVRRVIGRGPRLERAAVAAQVGAYDGEPRGELRCHGVPHEMALRVAMEQEQRRARAAVPHPNFAVAHGNRFKRELIEETHHGIAELLVERERTQGTEISMGKAASRYSA